MAQREEYGPLTVKFVTVTPFLFALGLALQLTGVILEDDRSWVDWLRTGWYVLLIIGSALFARRVRRHRRVQPPERDNR